MLKSKIKIDKKNTTEIIRSVKGNKIKAEINKIKNIKLKNMYIEKKTIDKYGKEDIKNIENLFLESFKLIRFKKKEISDLKIVMMDLEESFASYLPNKKIIFINPKFFKDKFTYNSYQQQGIFNDLACNKNILSTIIHELTHYKDENYYYNKCYRKGITKSELQSKIRDLISYETKIMLDFIEKSSYNISDISIYAENSAFLGDIRELTAELSVKEILNEINETCIKLRKIINNIREK
ncbi:hypothetical protein HP397_06345 [Streptobacillus felis]|uniref:Uncharacterized protein n=1 Tax=Streptobacillus felis TaxID=1384509 RepID=A0A7Z0PFQ4_9FUSO|nr:hypothetical protein [Streptobacillus felis]NYV28419.1 hypothetical protein [Streptobacillus felis]